MIPPIETAGVIIHATRIPTEWGAIRIHLVAMPDGKVIRLVLPTKLPAAFRVEAARVGRWLIAQHGHSIEAVAMLEAALREALDLNTEAKS